MNDYTSALHEFIDRWVQSRDTTWDWLLKTAGVPGSAGTNIRRGSTPQPKTLRNLAAAMGVPRRKLFEFAGYVLPEELEPEDIQIDDPELSMFFRGYEWDEFTSDEKELIRTGVRMALLARKAREHEQEDEPDTEQE